MKTKEQELALLGLQEINESEKNEVTGGSVPMEIYRPIDIIWCCVDIPPMGEKIKWPWEIICL